MRWSPRPSSVRELRARAATRPAPATALVALLAALATTFAALLLTAGPAAAHNALRSSDPADGATVDTAPAQVTLTFDQSALELGTEVVVTAADGTPVSAGAAQLSGTSVVQPLAEDRPAGAYRVDWRVTSSDGHPISGSFGFTATAATGPAAQAAVATAAPAEETATATPEATEDAASAEDGPTAQAAAADDAAGGSAEESGADGGPGRGGPWLPILLIVLVIAGVLTFAAVRSRRRRSGRGDDASRGGPTAG